MQNKQMLKQLQEMQARMAEMQAKLAEETVEGTAGGGAVTVVANGHQDIIKVTVDPDAMDDAEILADMFMAAANAALQGSRKVASDKMSSLVPGGLPPGMF